MDFIPIANTYIGSEEADAVFEQVKSGWISMGRRVQEFEEKVRAITGAKHAVAMSNGTATLHAALLALGIGPGDDVVVPTLSYVSSANAVLYCGANVVFCEVDPTTFNVSAETIEAALTPATRAIMPVDLKGLPVDFESINALAGDRNLSVVADSAESFGADYRDRPVGAQCDIHSFSFFANKNITMGEGGAITTDDDALADACRVIRNQGQSERYVHVALGHNYRLTDLAAAFGIVQLDRLGTILSEKARIAARYTKSFSDHPLIRVPHVPDYCRRPSWYMYCLTLDDSVDRDRVTEIMRMRNVDHRLSFPPIHLQPYYRQRFGYKPGDFPVSERVFAQFIDIPCWAGMSEDQVDYVIETVATAVMQARR